MSKYTFKTAMELSKAKENFGTGHFSIVSYDNEPLFDFQKDIDSSLKSYNVERTGKKSGSLYNSLNEEIGIYEIISNE